MTVKLHEPQSELRQPHAAVAGVLSPADQRINILIVDDEPKNLTVLETVLANPNYRLVRAENANEALLALVEQEFALLILDIRMPEMSGLELAQLIKQRKKTAAVPIIFLTAYFSEAEHVLEGYETGAVDYLHKPVNAAILRSKVAVFADLHRKNREIAETNHALTAEVAERRRVEDQILRLNAELEQRVETRTAEISKVNLALRESEQLLRLSQAAGKVGLWEWDLATDRGQWTDSAREIFHSRRTTNDITGPQWQSYIHPEDVQASIDGVETAKATGRYAQEYRIVTSANEIRWIESIGAVEYEGGEPVWMRGSVRDITDRKLIELKLIETDRRKDEFLAMLGHELRNPLAAIRNAISILDRSDADADCFDLCREVLDRQTEQLTHLVNDLLDVSRITSGKIQLQREPFDLSTAVQQAIETHRPLIDQRQHQLDVVLPAAPILINGDPVRLAQAVGNLLNNAAKYTDPGGQIQVSLQLSPHDNKSAVIEVRDNGRGLDPGSLENLFELFYQVDRNLDRADGGLGIGLSLVHRLVKMHGGSIMAYSPGCGKGSNFTITLPCVLGAPAQIKQPELPAVSPTPTSLSILVVDDNTDSALSMAKLMQIHGHQVSLAYDGTIAVETALRENPAVVLLDIGLPGLDGYQVCRTLRAKGLTETKFIAMTGYGQSSDRERALEAGFDEHLVKPVTLSLLKSCLGKC